MFFFKKQKQRGKTHQIQTYSNLLLDLRENLVSALNFTRTHADFCKFLLLIIIGNSGRQLAAIIGTFVALERLLEYQVAFGMLATAPDRIRASRPACPE